MKPSFGKRLGEPDDERAAGRRRLAGSDAAAPDAPRDWRRLPTRRRPLKSSEGPAKWSPCCSERGRGRRREVERQAAQDIERFASQQMAEAEATEGFASAAEVAAAGAETAAAAGGALTALGEGGLAVAGAAGAATGGLVAAVGTAWAIEGGVTAASHMLGWDAETGGGTDSDASRPSRATDVQTLNGMQDSGAVDHFFIQEQRQQPRVFRIDTDSESDPQAQPRQQIRARPIRRQGQGRQQPTPFGINQVPIPVSSGSERSRISRQSRGDRGPLATPSFDALRTASEPEAA